jgi:hypothetical protein
VTPEERTYEQGRPALGGEAMVKREPATQLRLVGACPLDISGWLIHNRHGWPLGVERSRDREAEMMVSEKAAKKRLVRGMLFKYVLNLMRISIFCRVPLYRARDRIN